MNPKLCVARAWMVHLYTSLSLPLTMCSLAAIIQGNIQLALILNLICVGIDASDGTLARAFNVKKWAPQLDGAKLDDMADFATYVFFPVFMVYYLKMVPPEHFHWLSLPLIASGYGFCQVAAKTDDGFFTGFPSYWNIVVFYLYFLQTPPMFNLALLLTCSVLVFVPIKFLYPSRAKFGKFWLNTLGVLWGASLLFILYKMEKTPRLYIYLSLIYPAYYTIYSLILNLTPQTKSSPPSEVQEDPAPPSTPSSEAQTG